MKCELGGTAKKRAYAKGVFDSTPDSLSERRPRSGGRRRERLGIGRELLGGNRLLLGFSRNHGQLLFPTGLFLSVAVLLIFSVGN